MGLMGGRGTAAFGSHSASVLSKTTGVLVVLFFVISIGLAKINAPSGKPPKDSQTETQATTTVEEGGSLADDEAASASN